jgi:hypothetical protein
LNMLKYWSEILLCFGIIPEWATGDSGLWDGQYL